MPGRYLLALDAGTSGVRCLVADSHGTPLALAQRPVRYRTPAGGPSLAREFRPDAYFRQLSRAVALALRRASIVAEEVAAIGVTSQREGMVFLDGQGRELYAGPNIDLRAVFEGASLDAQWGEELYRVTGHLPSLMFAPARLLWFRHQRPQVYGRIATALTVAGWVAYRLTGELACEPSLGGEAGLLDIARRAYCTALLRRLGVSVEVLPPLVEAGTAVGPLAAGAAQSLGLRPGIPVTLAGADTQCGLLGMGTLREGQAGMLAGWSGTWQMVTSGVCLDGQRRTWAGCHPLAGRWVAESNLGDTGNGYRWLKETLIGRRASFAQADRLAREVPAGAEGVTAFLGGGPSSMAQAGLRTGGLLFPVPLSFQEVTPGQLLRAALENIAYAAGAHLALLERVTGRRPQTLDIGGGMARSQLFTHILADVLGKELRVSQPTEVSARGAALAAAVAAGHYSSLEEAVEGAAGDHLTVAPDPLASAEYQEHQQRWLEQYQGLGGPSRKEREEP